MKILLVDDDTTVQSLTVLSLKQVEGWEATCASSGAEALEQMEETEFDLVLLDILMPGMSGQETLEKIRQGPCRRIPVIFMTAFGDPTERRRLLDLGAAGVIAKPVDPLRLPNQISEIVSTWLQRGAVLVVDESMERRKRVHDVLERHQYRMLEAASAAEATSLLKEKTIRLIILGTVTEPCPAIQAAEEPVVMLPAGELPPDLLERVAAAVGASPKTTSHLPSYLGWIRKNFAAGLPIRLQEVHELAGEIQAGLRSPGLIDWAIRCAHNIHGSAGTFGFAAVGDALGNVERLLTKLKAGEAKPEEVFVDINRYLHSARHGLAEGVVYETGDLAHENRLASRVLVVSANVDVLDAAMAVEQRSVARIFMARTVQRARELTAEARIDAAIIDAALDETNIDLIGVLRGLVTHKKLPVAVVTNDDSAEFSVNAAAAGASRLLRTPVDATALLDATQDLLAISAPDMPRVLVVEDDTEYALFIGAVLEEAGLAVRTVADAEAAFNTLREDLPDLILLDVGLPNMSGLDMCRALRLSPRYDNVGVVMLTGKSDLDTRVAAFQAGADDYIAKPVLPEELGARVVSRAERIRLYWQSSNVDPVSGLMVRRPFLRACRDALATAVRESNPFALVLMELDYQGLEAIGAIVRNRFRSGDICARWMGDELALGLVGTSRNMAVAMVERLLEETQAHDLSFCAGVAAYPDNGGTLDELIAAASQRMRAGRRGSVA